MKLNSEYKKRKNYLEKLKYIIIIFLLFLVIITNYMYQDLNLITRLIIILPAIIIAIVLFMKTLKGNLMLSFIKDSKLEIKNVIWPTKQETLYTTIIVSMVTIIMSLFLWGLDIILINIVSFITNMRL